MRLFGENGAPGLNKIKVYHMPYSLHWKFVNDINIFKVLIIPTCRQYVGRETEEMVIKKAKRTRNFKKINTVICINPRSLQN